MFEKLARIFSRRHKQTTFSDAGFLGVLRIKRICLDSLNSNNEHKRFIFKFLDFFKFCQLIND